MFMPQTDRFLWDYFTFYLTRHISDVNNIWLSSWGPNFYITVGLFWLTKSVCRSFKHLRQTVYVTIQYKRYLMSEFKKKALAMYGHSNSGRNNTPCGDEKKEWIQI